MNRFFSLKLYSKEKNFFNFGDRSVLPDTNNLRARRAWLLDAFEQALTDAGIVDFSRDEGRHTTGGHSDVHYWAGRFVNDSGGAEVVLHEFSWTDEFRATSPHVSLYGEWTLLVDRLKREMEAAARSIDEAMWAQ